MIGRRISHFRIIGLLGAGGIGDVYRAEDVNLGREVALKVLSSETATDPDRLERFQREARVLAALDHPNIVTIHSVEAVDGVHFLTMELVDGRTLDKLIPAGGMDLDTFFSLSLSLAGTLAAAHGKGVIHRDLKPYNVIVTTAGRLKVLDFGLAKLAEPKSDLDRGQTVTQMTRPGISMGTPSYMSPEQIEAHPVDQRSDIFALGILLYEMATGRRPFEGASVASVTAAILKNPTPSMAVARPGLPDGLSEIVTRCLAKNPSDRYGSAADVCDALAKCQGGAGGGVGPGAASSRRVSALVRNLLIVVGVIALILVAFPILRNGSRPPAADAGAGLAIVEKSIAVLPFTNMSDDPENEYFSDGLTEELLNSLAQLSGLKVAARTSSFVFKDRQVDLRSVGEQLGVGTVLEGSVRRQGQRVRITAQLINAADGYHLWSETYDREIDDVFAIQSDIAERVADALRVTLLESDTERLRTPDTNNTKAYDAYLLGLKQMAEFHVDSVLASADSFRRALELDPTFAKAHAGIANAYLYAFETSAISLDELIRVAEPAMNKAISLDPELSEAHSARGGLLAARGEVDEAKTAFRTALDLNPDNSLASFLFAILL